MIPVRPIIPGEKCKQNIYKNNLNEMDTQLNSNIPAVLPLRAAIDVLTYSTDDALCLIADSLYAIVSPDFDSLVRTRFDIFLLFVVYH